MAVTITCLSSLVGLLCGLGARRGLRQISVRDDKSVDQAISRLPWRYALVGAPLAIILSVLSELAIGGLGEVAETLGAGAFGVAAVGGLAGAMIGIRTTNQVRKRLGFRHPMGGSARFTISVDGIVNSDFRARDEPG